MKTKAPLFLIIILLVVAGCEIDNYQGPQFALTGKIVDSGTGTLVESGGINAGSVVKLYEGNSSQPLIYNTLPDGSFINSKVFAGSYVYVAEGPFSMAAGGEQDIVIDKNSHLDIEVIPNLRLAITLAESTATTATINLTYEKLAGDQKLTHLAVVWSKFRNPNNFTFSGGSILDEDVEALDLTSGSKSFMITNLEPGEKYFIRGSGRTSNPGNYNNYSTQIEFQAQ